jgi:hypothetical protein
VERGTIKWGGKLRYIGFLKVVAQSPALERHVFFFESDGVIPPPYVAHSPWTTQMASANQTNPYN